MTVAPAPIGELVDVVKSWNPTTRPDDDFLYVDLSAVSQKEKRIVSPSRVSGAKAPSRARQLVKEGDILVSTVRPNLNGVAAVTKEFDGAVASTGFCVLRPKSGELASEYLMHWVQSPMFIDNMVREATGASYPAVSDRIVKSSLIPLPPLDEQRRIAAILDKADALRRTRKRALEITSDAYKSLVESSLTRSVEIELGDVILEGPTNGLYKPASAYGDGIPILRINNFYDGSVVDLAVLRTLKVSDVELERFRLSNGNIVINRVNSLEYLGKSALIEGLQGPAVYESNMMRFSVNESRMLPEVCIALLQTPDVKRQILRRAKNAVNQSSINQKDVKNIRLPLPSMSQQIQFRAGAKELNMQKQRMVVSQRSTDLLFASLQHRAFTGQL